LGTAATGAGAAGGEVNIEQMANVHVLELEMETQKARTQMGKIQSRQKQAFQNLILDYYLAAQEDLKLRREEEEER